MLTPHEVPKPDRLFFSADHKERKKNIVAGKILIVVLRVPIIMIWALYYYCIT